MKKKIVNTLHISRQERMSIVSLIVLVGLVILIPEIYRYIRPNNITNFDNLNTDAKKWKTMLEQEKTMNPTDGDVQYFEHSLFKFNPNTATVEELIELGLDARTAKSINNYREKGGKFRKAEDFKKIYTLSEEDYERLLPYITINEPIRQEYGLNDSKKIETVVQLFAFDPNQASKQQFIELGLPEWLSNRIVKYRNSGGRFVKKEDLSKIYGFPKADYDRLEPYINIPTDSTSHISLKSLNKENKNPTSGPSAWRNKKNPNIEVNTSDIEQWQLLPGIGEKRAVNIIKYRERLGGFVSIEQIAEVRSVPDSIFQLIKPLLSIEKTEVKKLNINTSTNKELSSHPYISFSQANLIVADRNQNGEYKQVEDLLRIKALIDKEWVNKTKPYLIVK